jgi:hypothetical protein
MIKPSNREPTMTNSTLTIRRAAASDLAAVADLAALDSSSPPTGEVLLAEVGNELWAAIEVDSGAAIADPFRPSGDVVELLRFRAERARRASGVERRSASRLLPRAA